MEKISKEKVVMPPKYHIIKDIKFESNKLLINIDQKEYSFDLNSISKKLYQAGHVERNHYQISPSGYGIHWPTIDEDLSIDGLLKQRILASRKRPKIHN